MVGEMLSSFLGRIVGELLTSDLSIQSDGQGEMKTTLFKSVESTQTRAKKAN